MFKAPTTVSVVPRESIYNEPRRFGLKPFGGGSIVGSGETLAMGFAFNNWDRGSERDEVNRKLY